MMYDSGYLAGVRNNGWDGHSVTALSPADWQTVHQTPIKLDDY